MVAFEWLYTILQLYLICEKVGKNAKILCVQAFVLLLYIREVRKGREWAREFVALNLNFFS